MPCVTTGDWCWKSNLICTVKNGMTMKVIIKHLQVPHIALSPLCGLTHLMFMTIPTRKEKLSLVPFFQVKELRQRDWEVGDSYKVALCCRSFLGSSLAQSHNQSLSVKVEPGSLCRWTQDDLFGSNEAGNC